MHACRQNRACSLIALEFSSGSSAMRTACFTVGLGMCICKSHENSIKKPMGSVCACLAGEGGGRFAINTNDKIHNVTMIAMKTIHVFKGKHLQFSHGTNFACMRFVLWSPCAVDGALKSKACLKLFSRQTTDHESVGHENVHTESVDYRSRKCGSWKYVQQCVVRTFWMHARSVE